MSGIQRTISQAPLPMRPIRPYDMEPTLGPLYDSVDSVYTYLQAQQQSWGDMYDLLSRSINNRSQVGLSADRPTADEAGWQYLKTDTTPDIFAVGDGSTWSEFPSWSVPLTAVLGGTGQTSYAVGDLLYANTTTTLAKLADVAAGAYLRSGGIGVAPLWSTLTLPNAATTGDLPYASATNVVSMLADVAAGSYLRSGGAGVAPLWSTITIPNAATTGDLWYASATSVISALGKGTSGYYLKQGASIPSWVNLLGTSNTWSALQNINVSSVSTSGSQNTLAPNMTAAPASSSSAAYYGLFSSSTMTDVNNATATVGVAGLWSQAYHSGSGTVTGLAGIQAYARKDNTGPVTNAYGCHVQIDNADASGAIGSAYGLYVNTFGRTGTITNAWGVYVKDATLDNYFSGRVGFGTTTFGTSAAGGVLGIANASVVPASSPADMIQLYAKDSSAGAANSTVAVRTEQGVEAIGTFTASHKLRVWINEVEYHIQLDAV